MTNDEFIKALEAKGYSYRLDGERVVVNHSGWVYLPRLTSLPEGVTFENGSNVYLASLTSLPPGVTFENDGCVNLNGLTSLPEGVVFKNNGSVYLDRLTGPLRGVTFENGDNVSLSSITTLTEGIRFENGGWVYLPRVTTLPEGVTFENDGYAYMTCLDGLHTYQGKERLFRNIDGYTMLIASTKVHGETTIYSARYFKGGPVDEMPKCYIAERDGVYAHGNAIQHAIDDLEYKLTEQANYAEVAATVKASGQVTLAQFRALTGACREGIRRHLQGQGIDLDALDAMPLDQALDAMAGTTYGETFVNHLEGVTT